MLRPLAAHAFNRAEDSKARLSEFACVQTCSLLFDHAANASQECPANSAEGDQQESIHLNGLAVLWFGYQWVSN